MDILLEHCELGRAPFPFEVPYIGMTQEQRAQVRQAVFRDLEGRGHMRSGRLDADVQIALKTLVRSSLAITAVAQLKGDGEQLFARGAREGQFAVVVRQDRNLLVFDEVRPTNIVAAVVDLLPLTPAGSGQSVTVAKPAPSRPRRRVDEDSYDPFAEVSAPRTQSSAQLRAVERLFEKPQVRVGQFTAFVRGQDGGKERMLDSVAWFDTEEGRYFCTSRSADDGQQWLTYAPADNARIAQHLYSQLERYL